MAGTIEPNPILNELVDFVNGWKSQKGISQITVLSGDILTDFVNDLQNKIVEVAPLSGKPGQTLILYSGKSPSTGKNIYAELEEFCKTNSDFYYITNTDGGAVLWKEQFQKAIIEVIGDRATATRILSGKGFDLSTGKPGSRIDRYAIDGTDILALDDFISQTITKKAIENGNPIVYVAGKDINPNSVWALTELPEAMNDLWIGRTLDEALANKITIVGDLDQIIKPDSNLISDVSLRQTIFYTDSDGKIVGVELDSDLFSEGFSSKVGQTSPEFNKSTYGSQLGVMSDLFLSIKIVTPSPKRSSQAFLPRGKSIIKRVRSDGIVPKQNIILNVGEQFVLAAV